MLVNASQKNIGLKTDLNDCCILILFEHSWAEVDWILPVLFELKRQKSDWLFFAVFSKIWEPNISLATKLTRIVDKTFLHDDNDLISTFLLKKNVRIILQQLSDTTYTKQYQKAFPSAKIVLYPHGPKTIIPQKQNSPRQLNNWNKRYVKHDLLIEDSDLALVHLCRRFSNLKFASVGFPRFDHWWGDMLIKDELLYQSIEYQESRKAERVFLFIDSFIYEKIGMMPLDVFDYVVRSILDIVFSQKNNYLLIKPHPRQKMSLLTSILENYESSRFRISNMQTMQLAYMSDMVISVYSSSILDALAVGRPVIEFQPLIKLGDNCVILDQYARLCTPTQLMKLTAYARTKEDVIEYVDDYFNLQKFSIWHEQRHAFEKLCRKNINASQQAAKQIINLIEPGEKDSSLSLMTPSDSISNLPRSSYIQKDGMLNLEIEKFKSFGMPINKSFLNALHQSFELEVLIATGDFNEHFLSESARIFNKVYAIESSSDLYQPLFMKEFEDIKNVEIFHSANILKSVLPQIKNSKILFWLSINEVNPSINQNRTNTSVIEELKVILNSQIKNAVILINNVCFFRPIKVDCIEGSREYPSLIEVKDILKQIYDADTLTILGDIAIAYPQYSRVNKSMAVQACTLSRQYNGYNIDSPRIMKALNYMAFELKGTERESLRTLYQDYISYENYNVGAHFYLWSGLIWFGDKIFLEAKNNFLQAIHLGANDWITFWFLSQSAFYSKDNQCAKIALTEAKKRLPNDDRIISFIKEFDERLNK